MTAMNTTRLLTGLVGLLLVGMLLSCVDHRSLVVTPGANRLRVKKIEQVTTVTTVMDFAYDGQSRLSSITSYRTPDSTVAPVEKTLYQYDAQSRLAQVGHSEVRRGSRSETYFVGYNSAGQVSGLSNSPSNFVVVRNYNTVPGPPLSDYSKTTGAGGIVSSGGGSFTFTAGNLTGVSETLSVFRAGEPAQAPPIYSRSLQATYTYDVSGINPFYGNFIIPAPGVFLPAPLVSFGPFYTLYGGIDNPFNLSPMNVETSLVVITGATNGGPSGTTNTRYTYTYNAAGLPTSRTTNVANNVTEILRFDYESY